MKIILSHAGKQHSYYVARALRNVNALQRFYTSSYVTSLAVQSLVKKLGINYLQRRYLEGLGGHHVSSAWKYEMKEVALRLSRAGSDKVNNAVFARDIAFDKAVSKSLRRQKFDAFWGFQGSCLHSVTEATKLNKVAICEMTIAHLPFAKKILTEEASLQPDWAESIDFFSFPAVYEERLIEEPLRANRIIAISEFLKTTLVQSGIESSKIDVIPLGYESSAIRFDPAKKTISKRPLRVLFAGRVTQRKGVSYLLDAFSRIKKSDVELHIIGNIHGSGNAFRKRSSVYEYLPGVSQHALFNMYSDYDVLVFPSLLEGFGLVTIEAMGAGLPVITTANTNAYELIENGVNGYVIPIRDSNAIREAVLKFRSMSDQNFHAMRMAAHKTASNYTWSNHEEKIGKFVKTLIT